MWKWYEIGYNAPRQCLRVGYCSYTNPVPRLYLRLDIDHTLWPASLPAVRRIAQLAIKPPTALHLGPQQPPRDSLRILTGPEPAAIGLGDGQRRCCANNLI